MFTHTLLILSLVAAADDARYPRGQEFVYRGQCVEAVTGDQAGPRRSYEILTRHYVLEADREMAVATTVTDNDGAAATRFAVVDPMSVRLPLNLDKPAPLDPVVIPDLPEQAFEVGVTWSSQDGRRPPRGWKVEAAEVPPQGGGQCWKVRGSQQSTNWDAPDGNKAWRREDLAWIDAKSRIVQRLERVLLVRETGTQQQSMRRIITCHQLESKVTYPGQLDAEVRAEILAARQAAEKLTGPPDPRALDGIARRLTTHINTQPATEWRNVVAESLKQIEAARRGDIVTVAAEVEAAHDWTVGRPAPDFAIRTQSSTSCRLADCRGKPIVIGVFQSMKPLGLDADKALRALAADGHCQATVVAVDQSDICDAASGPSAGPIVRRPSELQARGLVSCGVSQVESLAGGVTPRFILIDERGIVFQIIEGYGTEVPMLLRRFVDSSGPVKPDAPAGYDGRK